MSETAVVLTLKKGRSAAKVEGTRVAFSAHQCFAFNGDREETECLRALGRHLLQLPGVVLVGSQQFIDRLLAQTPELKTHAAAVIADDAMHSPLGFDDRHLSFDQLPPAAETVFLAETYAVPRWQLRRALPQHLAVIEPSVLADIAPERVPARAWTAVPKNIYPIDIPDIKLRQGLDLVLMDCPSRNLALMPNGLAYVSNALKKSDVSYQVFDLDIIAYHRFHMHRLFDVGGRITLPSGRVLPEDPWQAEHYDVWAATSETSTLRGSDSEVIRFFRPLIDQAIAAVAEARPKVLGLSIQQCNEAVSRAAVNGVKERAPDTVILVGGFSCYNADIGLRAFPECDYMCIGESDLTVGPLIEALARGERPANQAGVLSRYDTPDYSYIPAPMVHNLDHIESPRYEWTSLDIYRNYNDYQLTPIIASRGCRWSRCTFCAERFYWRIRSPQHFVDELEWLVEQGCYLFMFNESDLNGMPEKVMEICDEIIRRGLHRKVKLTGQLRIHKKSNRAFFQKLRAANFVALRFGVDAFSENTLRLQKKGYTVDMVSQNLKDCWESGIYTEVNWVIGIPGETDADVEEGIELILKNREYIGRLANINPLILVNGGVYWIDPKAHHIEFKEPQEQLYAKFPRALPADSWYSTNPYIDAQVRKERFERIVVALYDAGFPVGPWAHRIIEDVKLARDPNRAAAKKTIVAPAEQPAEEMKTGLPDDDHLTTPETDAAPEPAGGRKIIPIKAGAEKSDKLAAPPLHGVAGQPPRLVKELENHKIIFFDGWYYGVPHVLGDVDVSDPDPANLAGVIRHTTEEGVIAVIKEASYWANTRGQYDAQEQQRAAGSYMRVDSRSTVGESVMEKVPEKPAVIRYKGEYIAIDLPTLRQAFDAPKAGFFAGKTGEKQDSGKELRTPLRRLASKLPPGLQQEIKRVMRSRAIKQGVVSGALITRSDRELLRIVWRGMVDEYLKKPLTRILKGAPPSAPRAAEEMDIGGEKIAVLAAVTKNALPELMWAIDNYNLVKYDGMFYALPHGMPVDWEDDVAALPGVFVGAAVREVVAMIERATKQAAIAAVAGSGEGSRATGPAGEFFKIPQLLGMLEGYNIVSYEGWVYGIPQELGPVDLTETDIMELAGVIRDVSKDVVENEILDRVKTRQAA